MVSSTPLRVVLAACHLGQAKALGPIVDLLISREQKVAVMLDANQPAAKAHAEARLSFPGCDVHIVESTRALSNEQAGIIEDAGHVIVTMSPHTERLNVEGEVFRHRFHNCRKKVSGFSEVVCGHRAPIWESAVPLFDKLFVAKKTTDLEGRENVVEVGMHIPTLDRTRALETKAMLGIPDRRPFIWYCGGPYPRAAEILRMLVECCSALKDEVDAPVDVVFSRHSRDDKRKASQKYYQETVRFAERKGVCIIENSADHKPQETTNAQRKDIIPYSRLFEVCSENGVIVTGHGTDGLKAPYCGIPSVLCVGDNLNPHVKGEKGCFKLPLTENCPVQVMEGEMLMPALLYCLTQRVAYQMRCRKYYPAQAKTPAEIIVDTMLQ